MRAESLSEQCASRAHPASRAHLVSMARLVSSARVVCAAAATQFLVALAATAQEKLVVPRTSGAANAGAVQGTSVLSLTAKQSGTVGVRKWLAPLVHERTIGGGRNDELLMPSGLATDAAGQIVLFDFGSMELRAFSRAGRPLWRVGRKGAGPGEFTNAMDVKVRANGEFAVLDMGNRRITTVSRGGKVLRTIPVNFSSSRFVPLTDTTMFALTVDDSATLWAAVNASGSTVRSVSAPRQLVTPHALVKEAFTASNNAQSAVTYRWSSTILLLKPDGSVQTAINGVEYVPLPDVKAYPMKNGKFSGHVQRINPKATTGAYSVAMNSGQIFVLFGGATANRGRIIDVYNVESGVYVGSYLLPAPALEIALLPGGGLVTLRSDPLPAVDVWSVAK